jgi:hypothetical protein
MKYFEEIDAWLTDIFQVGQDEDYDKWFSRITQDIKEKLLESYRNGKKSVGGGGAGDDDESPRDPKKRRFWPRRQAK